METNTAPEQENLTLGEKDNSSITESEAVENDVEGTESTSTAKDIAGEDNSDTNDEDSEDSESKKSGKGFEKRIERFNRRLAEKEAEIEHWRKAALQSGNQSTPQSQVAPVMQTEKPKFSDFNDIDAYTDAVTDWKLEQREAAQRLTNAQQTYKQREDVVRKAHADYDEVSADFRDRYKHVSAPEFNAFINDSDLGPEMWYHLANNTTEVDRILALSPIRRVAELGKLEAKLSTVGSVDTKVVNKVSKAPKPVTKETGVAPRQKRLDDPNLSQSEWRELRMQTKRRF